MSEKQILTCVEINPVREINPTISAQWTWSDETGSSSLLVKVPESLCEPGI
jgi:hypothetical protein